jgi:hypothetical protein
MPNISGAHNIVNNLTLILSSRTATLVDSARSSDADSGEAPAMENDRCVGLDLTTGVGADGVEGVALSSLLDESSFDRRFWLTGAWSLPAGGKPFNTSLVL